MAIPVVYILLGLLAGHHLKKLIRKHLNIKDFETEMSELVLAVIDAKKGGKKFKERKVWKEAKEAGIAYIIDKILK